MTDKSSETKSTHSFFELASFGKRMEFSLIADMLKEGLDIYRPMVDDKGIDCILRRPDDTFAEIQIKARSAAIGTENAGRFAGILCEPRRNYWFVSHSAKIGECGTMWIMNSLELVTLASRNVSGKNAGKYTMNFDYVKKGKDGVKRAYVRSHLEKYISTDFTRIIENGIFIEDSIDHQKQIQQFSSAPQNS